MGKISEALPQLATIPACHLFTVSVIFAPACAAVKFSVLFFYHRIFVIWKFTIWCIIVGVVTLAWPIASSLSTVLACRPIAYYSDRSTPNGHCANLVDLGHYVRAPGDIPTNIAFLIMPIPFLWRLHMDFQESRQYRHLSSGIVTGSIIRVALYHEFNLVDLLYCLPSTPVSGSTLNLASASSLSASIFASRILSRFIRSRVGESHRLRDANNSTYVARSKTLGNGGIYAGGGSMRQPRSWFDNTVSTGVGKSELRTSDKGSQEGMAPMGKIQVRHDVEWEQEDGRVMAT